jgi:hypothetical protein
MGVPDATFLDANLRAHRARWGFAPEVEVDNERVRVERTAGDWPRVSWQAPDGRWLRLHSDRQPLDEASRWLARAAALGPGASLVCLIGVGYGYALDVLGSETAVRASVLALEPDPALLRLWLGRRDWTDLIAPGRLMALGGPAFHGRTEAWRLVRPEGPDPVVVSHPVLGDQRVRAAREAAEVVAYAVTGARANEEARRRFAGRYLLNTIRNLPHVAHGPDPAALDGRFTGVPAVLVAAGPSLDRNLRDLRAVADRALVVATDTAWRPLAAAGIDPPLVVAADPSDVNARHLIDVPSSPDTWLIAEASVDPRALDGRAGRVAAYRVAGHHPWPWLLGHGLSRRLVRVWGRCSRQPSTWPWASGATRSCSWVRTWPTRMAAPTAAVRPSRKTGQATWPAASACGRSGATRSRPVPACRPQPSTAARSPRRLTCWNFATGCWPVSASIPPGAS